MKNLDILCEGDSNCSNVYQHNNLYSLHAFRFSIITSRLSKPAVNTRKNLLQKQRELLVSRNLKESMASLKPVLQKLPLTIGPSTY